MEGINCKQKSLMKMNSNYTYIEQQLRTLQGKEMNKKQSFECLFCYLIGSSLIAL